MDVDAEKVDIDAERQKLEDEKGWINAYIEHPITVQVLQDSAEQQEKIIDLLCNQPISNMETFFAHFEAIGHLRGLRRAKAILLDKVDDIETQLKEIAQ